MKTIIGYGCTHNNKFSVYDETAYKKTRVFKQLQNLFIPDENIIIDVLTLRHTTQDKLQELLNNLAPGDCIVIPDISSLAKDIESIAKYYEEIYNKGIGLCIPDKKRADGVSALSTTDFSFDYRGCPEEDFKEKYNKLLKSKTLSSNTGRPKGQITQEFIECYWYYENYFISEEEAYDNALIKVSKVGFHNIANEYERTPEYAHAEEEQERLYGISSKPKRNGKVPDYFKDLHSLVVNSGMSISEACHKLGQPVISEITYRRFLVKLQDGRSGMVKASMYLARPEIANKIKKH